VDHGPGLLRAFLCQIWSLLEGVGLRMAGLASLIDGLLDWLAAAGDNVSTEVKIILGELWLCLS
jgi:hypothetical protein